MFIAVLFPVFNIKKQLKCPSTEWIKNTHTPTHKYNGILSSNKRNEILPFAESWMDLACIMFR